MQKTLSLLIAVAAVNGGMETSLHSHERISATESGPSQRHIPAGTKEEMNLSYAKFECQDALKAYLTKQRNRFAFKAKLDEYKDLGKKVQKGTWHTMSTKRARFRACDKWLERSEQHNCFMDLSAMQLGKTNYMSNEALDSFQALHKNVFSDIAACQRIEQSTYLFYMYPQKESCDLLPTALISECKLRSVYPTSNKPADCSLLPNILKRDCESRSS